MAELVYLVPANCDGQRLNAFLRGRGVSVGLIRTVKYEGKGFYADSQAVHTDYRIRTGQKIHFLLPPDPPTSVLAQDMLFGVRYEDADAAVLEKPAGMAVHPTLNYPDHTLANGWLYYLGQKGKTGIFRPVNRIDKNTSGLVLCAKNSFSAAALAHNVQKRYLAVVSGRLPLGDGCIDAPIGRRADSIIGRCVTPQGKPSVTKYCVLAVCAEASLVSCTPITGRTHQIRVHFASMGHPLLGDSLYGGPCEHIARHALHCAAMWFRQPVTGAQVFVSSELPADLRVLCRKMGLPDLLPGDL
jgi:23S rRNA pseudouridine1911/1915/1917 synthase